MTAIDEQDITPSGFLAFSLHPDIIHALDKMNFKKPSEIQQHAIPHILERHDLIALAQTGSGKTAASAIPLCHLVDPNKPHIQALVVVPTRELALQYATETQKIGNKRGIKAFALLGGEDPSLQKSKLQHGVQILIATPGRLIDFIYSKSIDLSHIEICVLDEADELLGLGFYDDLEFIFQCLLQPHQTILFSATMPETIRTLAHRYMLKPVELNLSKEQTISQSLEHAFIYTTQQEKPTLLADVLMKYQPEQAIIFGQSRMQVEALARTLQKRLDQVDFLHAGLSQDLRTVITNKFRSGKIRFLVTTDVVARGLDFSHVTHVFLYSLPKDADLYVHRSGRTGRYDKQGTVISFVTHQELPLLKGISKRLNSPDLQWVWNPPPNLNAASKHHRPYKRPYRSPRPPAS